MHTSPRPFMPHRLRSPLLRKASSFQSDTSCCGVTRGSGGEGGGGRVSCVVTRRRTCSAQNLLLNTPKTTLSSVPLPCYMSSISFLPLLVIYLPYLCFHHSFFSCQLPTINLLSCFIFLSLYPIFRIRSTFPSRLRV